MLDLSHLNEPQREAVLHTEGPLLVLAGAGSGKTAVLTLRTAKIVENGTPPWAILAITFTNKAAGEIRGRLEKLLGSEGRNVWACTFHSACVRILRRDIEALGYGKSFTIYDTDDQKRVMKGILKALNLDEKRYPPGAVLSRISAAKDNETSPDAYLDSVGQDSYYRPVAECYKAYQKALREANALDFDDIIALTVLLFRKHPEILAYYQKRFSYILIDEYQDTNRLQYALISMLAEKHRNLCVVGDDDQSIYKFRGATIENILSFEKQYPDARVIRLEQNYRSTGAILEAANRVISRNRERKGKTLWTGNETGEAVSYFEASNENDEARFISETILDGKRNGAAFGDFCVLYRMNAQSGRIEGHFRMSGIPYRIIGGQRFFDRAEIKDLMSYLQIIHNPEDDLRLMRILNVPIRGLGDKSLALIRALALRDSLSCFAVLSEAERYPELARSCKTLRRFAEMIVNLRENLEGNTLPEFYEMVLDATGYTRMLREKGDEESLGRLENIMELKSYLAQYAENDPENASLGGFLDDTALFTDLENYDENEDTVIMMTIHSAKGLEFPTVFLAGAEEGIFPGSRSMQDPSEIEEERRLCYVAATRARRRLFVTGARERMLYGTTSHNPPSRFIGEMGLEKPPLPPPSPAFSPATSPYKPAPRRESPSLSDRPSFAKTPSAPLLSISKGDSVTHKRFGKGMVLSVMPMSGDALLEIAFEEGGTRKLMQKSAAAFLSKP